MAKYRCSVCGYIYDEESEGAPFSALKECRSATSPPKNSLFIRRTTAPSRCAPKLSNWNTKNEFVREDPAAGI